MDEIVNEQSMKLERRKLAPLLSISLDDSVGGGYVDREHLYYNFDFPQIKVACALIANLLCA